MAASCKGVESSRFLASFCAPATISNRAMSVEPAQAASCSGVDLLFVLASFLAPLSIKNWAASLCPRLAASWSAVRLSFWEVLDSSSAPAAKSSFILDTLLARAAARNSEGSGLEFLCLNSEKTSMVSRLVGIGGKDSCFVLLSDAPDSRDWYPGCFGEGPWDPVGTITYFDVSDCVSQTSSENSSS